METDAEYLNRTLAPELTKFFNQVLADEGIVPSPRSRQPRTYRETFKGGANHTYMIRHTRMKDEDGIMGAVLFRKRGSEWNKLDYCEAKTRNVIDRKIRTWKNRYEA